MLPCFYAIFARVSLVYKLDLTSIVIPMVVNSQLKYFATFDIIYVHNL